MDVDLSHRTAIVTGAGRGIGREIAIRFAAAGADVILAARSGDELGRVVDSIEDDGGSAFALETDLRVADDIDNLVENTARHFGPADLLVNNAGAHVAADVFEQTLKETDMMLDVNMRGLFYLSQQFATKLVDQDNDGGGRIVNISSIVGELSVPAMAVYCGTKAGVYGLTRGLAGALAPNDITVNSVSPGLTRVDRIEALLESKGELYEIDAIPMGRLADPADIAAACLFLCSDAAEYITGIDLPVDGGAVITSALYQRQYR